MVRSQDRKILRDLATRVAEVAHRPQEEEKKRPWFNHNSLLPGLPMVLAFPEGGWREILPEGAYCTDESVRWLEQHLRMILYTHEFICDDQVCAPFCNVPLVLTNNFWGVEVPKCQTADLGSYRWDPPLKDLADIRNLKPLVVSVDEKATKHRLATAQDIIGDILPVRLRFQGLNWPISVPDAAVFLRGMDNLMVDMVANPSWVHEFIGFLCRGRLKALRELESSGWLTLNNENDYIGSGGVAYTSELLPQGFRTGKVRLKDRWGFAEAQSFAAISPEMLDSFFISHIIPEMKEYGLTCYGCCEPLHDRLDVVMKIPHLRRISISPWADLHRCAEKIGNRYVFSWKPHPAPLAADRVDENAVRRSLVEGLRIIRQHGCIVEIILKDTHTVRGEPARFGRWVQCARLAVEEVWK